MATSSQQARGFAPSALLLPIFVILSTFAHTPVAYAVTISNITITPSDHGATVTFTTDQPSLGAISLSNQTNSIGASEGGYYTQHAITLYDDYGIDAQATYQLNIQAYPQTGGLTTAGPFNVTTTADVTAPLTRKVEVTAVASRAALVTWRSDTRRGSGYVDHGTSSSYGQTATGTYKEWFNDEYGSLARPRVLLTNLQPLTHYQFRAREDDGYSNQAVSLGNFTVTTDTLWSQYGFNPTSLYYNACVVVPPVTGAPCSFDHFWPPEMSWTGNEITVHFDAAADDLTQGALAFEVNVTYAQMANSKWLKLEVAAGTNPNSLTVVNPGGTTIDRPGLYSIPVAPNLFAPGRNYLRLRGITITDSEMGYGRVAPIAVWNRMQLRFTGLQPPSLTDAQLLDRVQAQAARYFWEQAFASSGLVRDITNSEQASIAATGFGLAALVVMADRYGTSAEWTVTPAQAQARAQLILDTAVTAQERQAADARRYGKAGLLFHFVEADGRRYRNLPPGQSEDESNIEVSTVDMALLTAGALAAGQYFGGTVKTRADQLAANVNWAYFFDSVTKRFYHAWTPNSCCNTPDGDGGFLPQQWDRPTDEVLLINLLALARDPANLDFKRSLYSWPRVVRSYAGYNVVNSFFGSLFTYLFGHSFLDLEALGSDNPSSVGATVQPVNWFLNAKSAALANRQFVIDQSAGFLTYTPEQWGLSACYRPDGSYFGDNGAKPAEFNNGTPSHDGTVPPYGAISAMPLVRTSPTEALSANLAFQALRSYHTNHYSGLWGPYGPRDALKKQVLAGQPVTAYSPLYVGIDAGPEVLMIEQYRSGLIGRLVMSHPSVRAALTQQFPAIQNRAPVLNPIPNPTTDEGQQLSFAISAVDPDGQALTYSATGLPAGASLTNQTFSWTPSFSQGAPGGQPYQVTFRATDPGGLSDTQTVTITVMDVSIPTNAETPWQTNAYGTLRTDLNWNRAMGYHFTPQVNGQVTALGGFFKGTKLVKLFNKATGALLASATVSANNTWSYTTITPVAVQAGTTYTVAVYLAGSGGSYRAPLSPRLPQTFGSIRIEASTNVYTAGNPNARPTNSVTYRMFGQADIRFVPTTSAYTLTASPQTIGPGGTVTVNWTAPSGSSAQDWIGLFPAGASNFNYLSYRYTNGQTSGMTTFTAPTTPGSYEMRYLLNNGYTEPSPPSRASVTVQ